jgi:signal transduction histidine kinase
MRLRTQLVAATLLFTFALTVALSLVFLQELLKERIAQTEAANDVLVHQVLATTRSALQEGLKANPPTEPGDEALAAAIESALQNDSSLTETLNGFVRYSPSLQDAFVSTASGTVLVSSDPAMVDRPAPHRRGFAVVGEGSLLSQRQLLFGAPEALDVSLPLERNGHPFLVAHLGIRSTLLRNAYAPWLRDAVLVCIFALAGALLVAAAISAAALRPIERISRELDVIQLHIAGDNPAPAGEISERDAVERVSSKITRIDEQMRTSEQTRTEMATNLNSMLQTLKDGVMLFTADLRVAMASDAISYFLPRGVSAAPGTLLSDVFPQFTEVGMLLGELLAERHSVRDVPVTLEDGRMVEMSLECLPGNDLGALLTLHDVAAQEELEHEIEVARRMASIGRLTAGVGHEVKNPINAMAIHLELLRGKLTDNSTGAQRHVEVLASEMSRLDRVVQTLADFSRPIEPDLQEHDLLGIVQAVVQLIAVEADDRNVTIAVTEDSPGTQLRVVADPELLRQALLNIALNAMQAMPDGGVLHINLGRDRQTATLSLRDTGTGIPPDKLDRIFDLYFTTKATGTGIGLSMTYRIIQLHGGVIQVKSDVDPKSSSHGTMFTLRLPLATRSTAQSHMAVTA